MVNQGNKKITVEVAYATPERQEILSVLVPEGTTLLDAARQSGIVDCFPEINLETVKMGIFGRLVARPAEQSLANGERVEIYRELIADPKEVRKRRAEQAKAAKSRT